MSELQAHILQELNRIAKKELDFDGQIEPAMSLKSDLKLDSMGMIIVAVGLENKFRVKLEEQDSGDLSTVGDLLALVERRVSEVAGTGNVGAAS